MRILLTNDDGINSKGIILLAEYLSKEHEVFVVAPDKERSATGHSITIHVPLWMKKVFISEEWWLTPQQGHPQTVSNSATT